MSVFGITLTDPTENVAPPERLLRVTAVEDLVFVSVEKYDETHGTTTTETVAEIAVSLPALLEAVQLLSHDRDREAVRVHDKNGPTARIGGDRLRVAPC